LDISKNRKNVGFRRWLPVRFIQGAGSLDQIKKYYLLKKELAIA